MRILHTFSAKIATLICFSVLAITVHAQSCNTSSAFNATACNIYIAPSGAQYDSTGIYIDTIPNATGCDSVMTINLEVFFYVSTTVYAATCGYQYTSDAGIIYCCTGLYQENHITVNGCDSTVFIDLTIHITGDNDEYINVCDKWTSDSGVIYDTSGVYAESFVDVNGCDSVIIYIVTIHSIDSSANWISTMTIEASEQSASYQWVDCNNNNTPIPGANSKIFVASVNGDYACVVSTQYCSATTNCVRVESLGVDAESNWFGIYPNPSNGAFIIELTDGLNCSKVEIANAAGQIVCQSALNNSQTNISLENVDPGVYFVTVSNDNTSAKKVIVIQ